MDRMLVVVFDSEKKAYEGKTALRQLADEGSISVYADVVIAKNADGTASLKQGEGAGPIGTLAGTAFGSLIGLLGGPVGVVAGATAGMAAGAAGDLGAISLGSDFVDDVVKVLKPGKVALVAEIDEEWVTPVDTRMEALGGNVFRRSVAAVADKVQEEHVAAMKADWAQMKAEHAQASAERKAKLTERINSLGSRIESNIQAAKERRETVAREAKAKAEELSRKAKSARDKAS